MATLARDPSKLFFQADSIRKSIISVYWLAIILALPLWWSTTSIERLSLPASKVTSQSLNHLHIPIRLSIDVEPDGEPLALHVQKAIDECISKTPERWKGLNVYVNNTRPTDKHAVYDTYSIIRGDEVATVKGRQLLYPIQGSTISELAELLTTLLVPFPTTSGQDRRVIQYSPRYRLSFTLLNEDATAGGFIAGWDIADAISHHISPILTQLSILHNFTIESQVQFHAPLAFSPHPLGDAFGISPEDLTVFINSADWTLSSSASNDPVLHFVLFIPSAARRPLHILDNRGSVSDSNAFLLPQWGSIVIVNPIPQEIPQRTELSSATLHPIFSAFSRHLLTLLGVPNLPSGVEKVLEGRLALTNWQLDALLRYRAINNAQGSKDALQSIINLVDQIKNMPVGHGVRSDIENALAALEQMHEASKTSLNETASYSARAFTLSSRAFFSPGMLALLYFPAEHKYAVYTPMFASAMIPLIVAAVKEVAAWRRQQRQHPPQSEDNVESK